MESFKLNYFENKPCKFILSGGKQVFGIIWKERESNSPEYLFTSAINYMRLQMKQNEEVVKKYVYTINANDLVYAELIDY